jgi:hypothetical protein
MKCLILVLFLGSLAPAGSAAPADLSEGFPRLYPPLVIDADGKIVGRYTYTAGDFIVPAALFDDDGVLTGVTLSNIWQSSYLSFYNSGNLSHTTTDCTGATYISSPDLGVRPGAAIFHDGDTFSFYLADSTHAEPPLRILSIGVAGACGQTDQVVPGLYRASAPPLDLTARFRLPLHLR